jgi:hypothetical protein
MNNELGEAFRSLVVDVLKDSLRIIVNQRREDGWIEFRVDLSLNDECISSDWFSIKEAA